MVNIKILKGEDFFLSCLKKRIAIIGNAITALKQEFNQNSFDIIVRFNEFLITEPSKLGTRTDIYCCVFAPKYDSSSYVNDNSIQKIFVPRTIEHIYQNNYFHRCSFSDKDVFILEKNEMEKYKINGYWISTGLIFLDQLLTNTNPEIIYLKGFDFFTGKNKHYFEIKKRAPNHKTNIERTFLTDIIEKNHGIFRLEQSVIDCLL